MLIDARKINHGGIGVYTQNLIRGILENRISENAAHDTERTVELAILGDAKLLGAYSWSSQVELIDEVARPYSFDELFRLGPRISKLIHSGRFSVFHTPHYVLPRGIEIPSVVTVHDVIHITHPQRFYYPWIAKPLIQSALNRASIVLTVSQASKQAMLAVWGNQSLLAEKIKVIPNSLDLDFSHTQSFSLSDREHKVLSQIQGPFLLGVFSTLKPHKGFADVISAYEAALKHFNTQRMISMQRGASGISSQAPQLVLAGQGLARDLARMDQKTLAGFKHACSHENIVVLGEVRSEVLRALYSQCHALVVPSLAEGFCIPALEALSAGARIVARPVAALQEVIGPHATWALDFSLDALSEALAKEMLQIGSRDVRSTVSRRILLSELEGRFNRKKNAALVLDAYKSVVKV